MRLRRGPWSLMILWTPEIVSTDDARDLGAPEARARQGGGMVVALTRTRSYKLALAIDEMGCGEQNDILGTTLKNLAEHYHAQSRYAEAEPLYRRALVAQAPTGQETRPGRPCAPLGHASPGPGGAALAEAGLGAGPGAADARGGGHQSGLVAGLH